MKGIKSKGERLFLFFFLIASYFGKAQGTSNELSYFLSAAEKNSPLLNDYNNQVLITKIDSLKLPAVRGVDTLNNTEQVEISFPKAGTYQIILTGRKAPGRTLFAMAWSADTVRHFLWEFPIRRTLVVPGKEVLLQQGLPGNRLALQTGYPLLPWQALRIIFFAGRYRPIALALLRCGIAPAVLVLSPILF
jgi:hypothetical protein